MLDTLIGIAIIGPLFTSLPLSDYIAHPMTHRYALNAIGDVYFYLPGVFAHNPWPELVNGQLWTLPFEMGCYAAITGLALFRLVKTRRRLLLASIGIAIALWIVSLYSPSAGGHIAPQDGRATLAQCFLFGVALYLYRDIVPHRLSWFIVAVIGTNVALIVPQLSYASAPLIVYITMYLGVLHPRRIAIVQSGDYSYGIFLYGFAIQQASVALLPGSSWVVNTVVAFAITIIVAVLSWRYVEKPALRLRAPLYRLENRWISFFEKMPFGQLLIARPVPEARPAATGR
jgi:peptidoglycan/LPS O-acetylase OafA/YrhL